MKHPTSEAVLNVINNFKKVLPLAKRYDHLDMKAISVCGTIHCHGGWYAVATCDLRKIEDLYFTHGVVQMEIDLGLEHIKGSLFFSLQYWAVANHYLWGNECGGLMFKDALAFYHKDKRPFGAQNLQHIIDHWTEVYERLLLLENQIEISDPPITAERLVEHLETKMNIDATNSISR